MPGSRNGVPSGGHRTVGKDMVKTAENTAMVNVMFALFMLMFVITAMDVKKQYHRRHGASRPASPAATVIAPAGEAARQPRVPSHAMPPPSEMKPDVEVKAEAVVEPAADAAPVADVKPDAGPGVDDRPSSPLPSSFWESAADVPGMGDMTVNEPAVTGIDIKPLSVD